MTLLEAIAAAAVTIGSSIANAARGGRFNSVNRLPGHTRFYASGAIALFALAWSGSLISAASWGIGYLCWAWLPWGRWFDLGHSSILPDRDPSWFERIIESASGGSDSVAFFLRNSIALLPAMIIISPWLIVLAFAQHFSYVIGWSVSSERSIEVSEYINGIAWGLAIVILGG